MTLVRILHYAIGPVGAGILGLLTVPILTWYFSADDIGRITIFQVILNLSVMIFSLSLHQAYVREYHEVDNKAALLKAATLPGLLLLLLFIVVLILILLIFPDISLSKLIFDIDSNLITVVLILSIVMMFFINILNHVVRMQERGLAFSIIQLVPKASFLLLVFSVVYLTKINSFSVLILSNFISIFLTFLTIYFLTKSSWLSSAINSIDKSLMIKMLHFSLPLILGGVAYWALLFIDRFFLKFFSGLSGLAVYSVSSTIASSVTIITSIFTSIWHPLIYKWVNEGVNHDKIQTVIDYMGLLVFSIWSVLASLSWILVYFLPDFYYEVQYILVGCIAAPLFYLLSETTVVGIGISRKSRYSLYSSLLAFFCNILLNYFLIPLYGAKGAAIASLVSFAILFFLRTEFSHMLWGGVLRRNLYILTIFYMVSTIFYVFFQPNSLYFSIVWLTLFIFNVYIYRYKIKNILNYISKMRGVI